MQTITKELIHKVIEKIKAGSSKRQALKATGFNPRAVMNAAARFGIIIPNRTYSRNQAAVKRYEDQIKKGTISQTQIAKELGLSSSTVSKIYRQLKLQPLKPGQHAKDQSKAKDDIQQVLKVIARIKSKGGYVPSTIKKLGLTISPDLVYTYAKDKDIDLRYYQHAGQKYGHWKILPGYSERKYTADYLVSAKCTLCGKVENVLLNNLRRGTSKCCNSCSDRSSGFKVKCVDTGETFPTVKGLVKHLNLGSHYRKILCRLKKHGEFIHNNQTFVLSRRK